MKSLCIADEDECGAGDTEVLRRKILLPVGGAGEQPAMSQQAIEALIGCKLPKITDISGQPPRAHIILRFPSQLADFDARFGSPDWRTSTFLVRT